MSHSLHQLTQSYPSILTIDSSSAVIQVGLLIRDRSPVWESSREESGVAIFAATEAVLKRSGQSLSDLAAFAFCDGPGSVLGIRTAAVALRTWRTLQPRPIFAYCSLDIVARFQLRARDRGPYSVIADARRDTWHSVSVDTPGNVSSLARLKPNELVGPFLMPEGFRHWATPPGAVKTVPYDIPAMLEALRDVSLFRESAEPDAFLHEEPVYQTWTPQVHRAPS